MKRLTLPLSPETISELNAGDCVLLSGDIYTARDCAHKRLMELLDRGEKLPFDSRGRRFCRCKRSGYSP